MSPFKISLGVAAAATTALLLAACGGNGGDDPAPIAADPTMVPASATGSISTWVAYAKTLAPTDSAEALTMDSVTTLPTSETEEPQAL